MSNNEDIIRLTHMLEAGYEVQQFMQDKEREDLDKDQMFYRAVCMSTGIIGEAAGRVSKGFQDTHPEIAWSEIIGMRNFLFHTYFKINKDLLWETLQEDVPIVIKQLEAILKP
jgi:uncharacterized protein with HEPN domain